MTDAEIVSDTPRTDEADLISGIRNRMLAYRKIAVAAERELTAERERAERNEKDADDLRKELSACLQSR